MGGGGAIPAAMGLILMDGNIVQLATNCDSWVPRACDVNWGRSTRTFASGAIRTVPLGAENHTAALSLMDHVYGSCDYGRRASGEVAVS
ncbi:hypothetical protein SAMN05444004_12130 [Jannaschia faecimaris]|uniref:Uncharacterized protein n=1 Tax=Jannaschia faecimaris TaxID=1244108 RepID=A0A1H3U053_9RHOB|nr:hypothetical protein [Jannaschia faecimaris]SDZ55687.1 hypothetical protein SAMN05444004_12130 [Jannaschia faecimaris]